MASETFKLVTPNMDGLAVRDFQRLLNERFAHWQILKTIEVTAHYDEETAHAAHQVAHGLGLNPVSYRHGMSPDVRMKIRHPDRRTPAELARGGRRQEWRAALRKRMKSEAAGPKAAIAFARKQRGVHETPANSNRGPKIDAWNRAAGVAPGPKAYWCGSFVNACLHAAGFPDQPFLAWCPGIETRAEGSGHGWSWHAKLADGKPGDLVIYTEGASSTAAHVELLVAFEKAQNRLDVVGGNTSAEPASGSQSNGGCVAEHHRDPGLTLLKFKGYARPPWSQ